MDQDSLVCELHGPPVGKKSTQDGLSVSLSPCLPLQIPSRVFCLWIVGWGWEDVSHRELSPDLSPPNQLLMLLGLLILVCICLTLAHYSLA